MHRAAARVARDQWIQSWPRSWYRELMDAHLPQPAVRLERTKAVDVYQPRAGHWSAWSQYLYRICQNPARHCPQCNDTNYDGARCRICREAADTPRHILMECPALMGTRFRILGTIIPTLEEVRSSDVVTALGAAARSLQSREATTV